MIRTHARSTGFVRQAATSGVVLAALLATGVATAHAQSEVIEYYATDALGSIRVVFDGAGQVTARSDYLPFGEAWAPTGNLPPQQFTGQQCDGDEGLDYFNVAAAVLL